MVTLPGFLTPVKMSEKEVPLYAPPLEPIPGTHNPPDTGPSKDPSPGYGTPPDPVPGYTPGTNR
jgi:hypothetical protein